MGSFVCGPKVKMQGQMKTNMHTFSTKGKSPSVRKKERTKATEREFLFGKYVAKGDDVEPKEFFKVLYQIILSTTRGPKIGPFILDIGKKNVAEKIGRYVK